MADRPTIHYHTQSRPDSINARWWQENEEEIWKHATGRMREIRMNGGDIHVDFVRHARMYSNRRLTLVDPYSPTGRSHRGETNRKLSYNCVRACIDTAVSKIGSRKPRPVFLTDDGNWDLQRRCQNLGRFVIGAFRDLGDGPAVDRSAYAMGRNTFRTACIFGTGFIRIGRCPDGKVRAWVRKPSQIIVDEDDGYDRMPREAHEVVNEHREVLIARYKEHKEAILKAPSAVVGMDGTGMPADMIQVCTSWHLPSSKDSSDGCEVVSIEGATLSRRKWSRPDFPFAVYRWQESIEGYYGTGMAEELSGYQLELAQICHRIQQGIHLVAVPTTWVSQATYSTIHKNHLNNRVGGIKPYVDEIPKQFTPQAFGPEIYNHLETTWRRAFEQVGISVMDASAMKPAGLNSGKAIREFHDIGSERFAAAGMAYEDFFLDLARLLIAEHRDMKEEGIDAKVRVADGNWTGSLKWSEVDVPDDRMTVQMRPAGILPAEPSGKYARAQEMIEGGLLDRDEAIELLDFPDVSKVTHRKLAPRQYWYKAIERMMDSGQIFAPDPSTDIEFGYKTVSDYYNMGLVSGMPDSRLALLRNLRLQIEGLQKLRDQELARKQAEAQQQARMQQGAAQPMPQMQPQPMPQEAI